MNNYETFLNLVRLGIDHPFKMESLSDIDFPAIKALAEKQGLLAVVLDGLERLRLKGLQFNSLQEKIMMAQWIGEVSQLYEQRYEQYLQAISSLAAFYNAHGYKMMVLKGYACSLDWPKPEHRPCGDIDIWQFGQQKEADATLARKAEMGIDSSHHHHTIFNWHDFMVENHYDFLNIHQHRSNVKLEKIVKQLAEDDSYSILVNAEKVYLPSPNLHALFLLRHAMTHFAASEINLRQLMDWSFFVEKHGKEVDWKWLMSILDEYGMTPAFNIFNAICVEDLGGETSLFPSAQFNPFMKDRVLNDILSPEFSEDEPKGLVARNVFLFRRWKENQWKHKLCFNESLWSAFWTGVFGHLTKPSC